MFISRVKQTVWAEAPIEINGMCPPLVCFSPNSLLLGFLMQLEIWPPWCWLVWSVSWALKWSCLPLSPIVSGCLPLCGGWVLVGVAAFLGSEVVLSPVVSGCLPSCGGQGVVGVAASRTKIFRNQNHRFQSKLVYCKLFGVYAGVIHLHYVEVGIVTHGMGSPPVIRPQYHAPFVFRGRHQSIDSDADLLGYSEMRLMLMLTQSTSRFEPRRPCRPPPQTTKKKVDDIINNTTPFEGKIN